MAKWSLFKPLDLEDFSRSRTIRSICSDEEFRASIERQNARAKRHGQEFAVVEFDVGDNGDVTDVGRRLVKVLCTRLRSTDEVGWLDKDHIGVLLYNCSSSGAVAFVHCISEIPELKEQQPKYTILQYPTDQQQIDSESNALISGMISRLFKSIDLLAGTSGSKNIGNITCNAEFYSSIEREEARSRRSGQPFSVVDFEIGEVDGQNQLAKSFLQFLSRRLRTTDEVGWLESGHAGVLLHNTQPSGAQIFVRQVLEGIPENSPPLRLRLYHYGADRNDTWDEEASRLQKPDFEAPAGEQESLGVGELYLLYKRAMPTWKRCMDLTISSSLLVALCPLFLAVAVLIKLFSHGSVFFKQQRVGYSGRIFTLWKFRTMKPNGESSAHRAHMAKLIKLDSDKESSDAAMVKLDDPRVTWIGKFLRFTYIDELPQLINVFRGEMSLVGPRPPTPYEVAEYTRWHTGRFDAFPGMTGLWQVSGKNRLTFMQMARLDIRYSQQMSWLLDVKILLSTPLVIASQIIKGLKTGKE